MSGLGELDRPGTPDNHGAWDERSQEWITSDPEAAEHAEAASARRQPTAPRRTTADPVRTLMHRHRELCEGAVDALEIAAGLEAHGVTDRTAARFRHRDVFSLAEEMFARAAHDEDPQERPALLDTPGVRANWVLLTLLPGTLATATAAALRLTHGQARLTVAAVGVLALALSVRAALSRGPLAPTDRTPPAATQHASGAWTYWFVACALLGDGLLRTALTGGPDGPPTTTVDGAWPLATAPVLALAWSCAPAAWTAHLFTVRARHRLTTCRGLHEFATAVRPLLLGTFALYLCALTALLTLCAEALTEPPAYAQTLTLGALLLLARVLTIQGFPHVPRLVLTATATAEATALATPFAGRLPGCGLLATPVESLVETWGPGAVPALICAVAALTLLIHATRTLARASAHAPTEHQC